MTLDLGGWQSTPTVRRREFIAGVGAATLAGCASGGAGDCATGGYSRGEFSKAGFKTGVGDYTFGFSSGQVYVKGRLKHASIGVVSLQAPDGYTVEAFVETEPGVVLSDIYKVSVAMPESHSSTGTYILKTWVGDRVFGEISFSVNCDI